METLLESVRLAIAPDATSDTRATGADACRSILLALEPEPTQRTSTVATANPAAQIAALATAMRGIPVDQLLDLAIGKLRTMVPTAPATPVQSGFSVPLIQVPRP